MKRKTVSTSSAKDTIVDLDDMALAMHADATGMSDADYAAAQARLVKRRQISQQYNEDSKAHRKELIGGITAFAFLALSIGAIVYTILNWNWQ